MRSMISLSSKTLIKIKSLELYLQLKKSILTYLFPSTRLAIKKKLTLCRKLI